MVLPALAIIRWQNRKGCRGSSHRKQPRFAGVAGPLGSWIAKYGSKKARA